MNSCEDTTDGLSLWIRFRRRFVRLFFTQGNCSGSCDSCEKCPWIDKEKYSFEIKRKSKEN